MPARSAPLKVVVAALVTEPTLAQDFENMHDIHAADLAAQLHRFQDAGDIGEDVDVQALAVGLEQMASSIGFLMQIVYRRPQSELEAIADTFANALTGGLQPDAVGVPIPAALRQQTVRRAVEASEGLGKIITLLENWPTAPDADAPAKAVEKKARRTATRRTATALPRQP